jgi:hypothetical protein
MSRGRSRRKSVTLRFCNPYISFRQAPSMSRGRVCDMREEKVGLDIQQMTSLE